MKQRILSVALALCLCISSQSVRAYQEDFSAQKDVLTGEYAEGAVTRDSTTLTPTQVYEAMTALKEQDAYKEGTAWTNDTPYSGSNAYHWKGGTIDGKEISAVGCVAFAFILSDAAFGNLPARVYAPGGFSFEDIKAGDILRVSNDAHTVIVLEVSDAGVVVAEGNISTGDHKGKVHWGRAISREEVMGNTSHYITRYPADYDLPEDPEAGKEIAGGTWNNGLSWKLTKAGRLTISGSGAMPDFGSAGEQPWSDNSSNIRKIVIEDGVTAIGSCAFQGCGVLSAEISASVTTIGSNAFRGSSIISVMVPSGVKTIGDSAFRECGNLSSVTVSEGVETIGQNAFYGCTSLTSIALPASIGEVGSAAFFQCTAMKSAVFAPGSRQVTTGDNLFTNCYYLMRVTLPQNMESIGDGMFQNCGMLGRVEIPQGVERIGMRAFASCSGLTAVVIPDSVTTIGTGAFSDCPLADIYFTGAEERWNSINIMGGMEAVISGATIHYNYVPAVDPDDSDDDDNDNNNNNNNTGDNSGVDVSGNDTPGNGSGDSDDSDTGSDRDDSTSAPSDTNSGRKTAAKPWTPTTPDEIRRYAYMGKEAVLYTLSEENTYRITIENAMPGPKCFESFEAVLGEYTMGRTYNICTFSDNIYSMDEEVQFTLRIPSAVYSEDREYKMICVTEGGQPILYDDLDDNPETITVKTDKFYAYALIYRQK